MKWLCAQSAIIAGDSGTCYTINAAYPGDYARINMLSYKRKLNPLREIQFTDDQGTRACFLFGPRYSGKTYLINNQLNCLHRHIDLKNTETFMKYSRNPETELRDYYGRHCKAGTLVVIDDIHRLPALLDAAYALMDKEKTAKFLFVTSSEHKLRRSRRAVQSDLSGTCRLHPLSAIEIGGYFDLKVALKRGLLPALYKKAFTDDVIADYVSLYLQEEIAPVAGSCNIHGFHRLLIAMAKRNGSLINYTDLATQTKLPRTTVQEYVRTVQATGMAYALPAWTPTSGHRAIPTSKLYLFDMGVADYLQRQDPHASTDAKRAEPFQHWVLHELRCFADFLPTKVTLAHWRSAGGHAVDFILNNKTAIAVDGTTQAGKSELRGLCVLRKKGLFKRHLLVCCEPEERTVDGIDILPYTTFVKRLWDCERVKDDKCDM